MDSGACTGEAFILGGLVLTAALIRLVTTALTSLEIGDSDENTEEKIAEKNKRVSVLGMTYDILKAFAVSVMTLLFVKLSANYELSSYLRILTFVAYIILCIFVFNFLTVDVTDRYAAKYPKQITDGLEIFFKIAVLLMSPIYVVQHSITKLIARILKLPTHVSKVTVDQIMMMVDEGEKQGVIKPVEREMIDGVMGFNDIVAEEIMTPRTEVFMIDINVNPKEYMEELTNYRYSRVPVYEGDIDNIVGILYLKDLFGKVWKDGVDGVDIRQLMKPAYFVPERKSIYNLFQEMQRTNKHMAVLMDEYGGFSGVITMEDLTEEIMGDIDDEFDADEPDVYAVNSNFAVVQGTTGIKDINDMLNLDLPEDTDDYDTIGGFVINKLGYIPEDNKIEDIIYDNIKIKLLDVEDRRIKKVKITIVKPKVSSVEAAEE